MKKLSLILFIYLMMATFPSAFAQNSQVENVKATIQQLFDGMRESESSKVAASFTNDATMQTVMKNQSGQTMINTGNLERFLQAIGGPKDDVWDERISSYDINIDGDLATAWTPYQFYIGDEFSHCGVNSFQLVNGSDGWKIFFIVDTRRQDNCID